MLLKVKKNGKLESAEHKVLRKQLEAEEAENTRVMQTRQAILDELSTLRFATSYMHNSLFTPLGQD